MNSIKRTITQLIFIVIASSTISISSVYAEKSDYLTARDIYYADANRRDRELQSLDIYYQDNKEARPIIIYVHGGGWAFGDKSEVNSKPDYFVSRGITFLSMNYRLRWDSKLYDQVEDVALVISWVRENAKTYGIDPSRIILMGNEAGAHLVSLLSTDARYLKAQNLKLDDIRAVIAIDTLSFDIPRVMRELGTFVQRRQHRLIFSEDNQHQLEASPIYHVGKDKKIPQFALLYVPDSDITRLQAMSFAKKLTLNKVPVIMIPGNSATKQTIDVELGAPEDAATGALMAFIRANI